MAAIHRNSSRKARNSIAWGLFGFAFLSLIAGVAVENWLPTARDPEFSRKLRRLLALREGAPEKPLILMLGSSRTLTGFNAEAAQRTCEESGASVFNFGVNGGGPFAELLILRRLIARGIKPDLLILEILPGTLNAGGQKPMEELWLQGSRLQRGEIGAMGKFHSQPSSLWRRWAKSRALPWNYLQKSAEAMLVPGREATAYGPGACIVDDYGWEPRFLGGVTEELRETNWQIAEKQYGGRLRTFQLARPPAGALQTVLELCDQERIPLRLVLMPEGQRFKDLYSAQNLRGIGDYLQILHEKWNVPIVDARDWLADSDFYDYHHPLPCGADAFSVRLAREVFVPFLESRPTIAARRIQSVIQVN